MAVVCSCLPCGHVYGMSCISKWIQQCGGMSAKVLSAPFFFIYHLSTFISPIIFFCSVHNAIQSTS